MKKMVRLTLHTNQVIHQAQAYTAQSIGERTNRDATVPPTKKYNTMIYHTII